MAKQEKRATKRWTARLIRKKMEVLGIVYAADQDAARAAAIKEFKLSTPQPSWWQSELDTASDRTPFSRMLPSVIGSIGSLMRRRWDIIDRRHGAVLVDPQA
jgi:hypothetical protein